MFSSFFSSKRFFTFFALLLSGVIFFGPSQIALANYHYEGAAFYANTTPVASSIPVYRFYNRALDKHFFTVSEEERNTLQYTHPEWGHVYEGIGFYAFPAPAQGLIPVYRLYNRKTDNHLYSLSEEEKTLITVTHPEWGYVYEGIAFYTYPYQSSGTVPVYRFYNPTSDRHFLTLSEIEKAIVINGNLGPDISVGLWSDTRDGIRANPFKIQANKNYSILDTNNNIIANVAASTVTRVDYDTNGNLRITGSIADTLINTQVFFQASDGNNSDMIFDVSQPNSSYDQFRGRVSVRYSDTSKNIWMINTLPLEQYVWGIGEITGTGDANYNRTMTTAFRTYGLWKVYYSTKYATEGFTVDATPSNQIYYGYNYETTHPNIKQAAQDTLGSVARYGSDIALSPFSSWTDGRTRSFLERWGSSAYPWCQSVADPYGKNTTMDTAALEASGNHMVGISAHGALSLATNSRWDWQAILKYYLTNIAIQVSY
jgi:peptidoglycan hydrolase-like amidase